METEDIDIEVEAIGDDCYFIHFWYKGLQICVSKDALKELINKAVETLAT